MFREELVTTSVSQIHRNTPPTGLVYRVFHRRRASACVDKNPERVPGEAANTDGALFYNIEAEKELTCAVCTK
jgi:hypothetical protein